MTGEKEDKKFRSSNVNSKRNLKIFKNSLCDSKGELPESVRKDLAKFLDQSVSQSEKIVYYGMGSFDALVSATLFALKIKPKELSQLVTDILIGLKKHLSVDESDRIWYGLEISKNKRIYYASLIEQAEKLADELLLNSPRTHVRGFS